MSSTDLEDDDADVDATELQDSSAGIRDRTNPPQRSLDEPALQSDSEEENLRERLNPPLR
ncbi:MAG: hypothetical protein JNM83_18420 [Myxococcales bacterium]|jgi:hypothetical protein|nr:hypothetical protein [Myxococcales bacterium]